jgi:site-specific recombinase XerD
MDETWGVSRSPAGRRHGVAARLPRLDDHLPNGHVERQRVLADSLVARHGALDGWVVPPDTADQRKRGRGSGRRTDAMAQPLQELGEQSCNYQRKQRGKTEGGVKTYRWILEQFLGSVKARTGRAGRVGDLNPEGIQAWMDEMAASDLALSTMRCRQSVVSSFCTWLAKRHMLTTNPVASLDRPPHRQEAPKQVPGPAIMDALIQAARDRGRPRDLAVFLVLRYTGMRRESVATLHVRHLDPDWGLRQVPVKGGKSRDIPLPGAVIRFLQEYVEQVLGKSVGPVTPDTPFFWSTWGRRSGGKARARMTGKNIWRLCKVYGKLIGYPMLKPHDLRHGVAVEVLEQHHDLEQVRALLGHARLDTTQVYTSIRPPQLKRAVAFYEQKAEQMLAT